MSIKFTSRCQPSIWLLLYIEFCYPWSLKVEEDQQYRFLSTKDEFDPFLRNVLYMCFQSFIFGVDFFCFLIRCLDFFRFVSFFFIDTSKAKYWKFNVDHYVMEHHQPILNYYITNIIETFKVMILHWLPFDDAPLPHPLFLMPKVKGFKITK
jgi:hypothetical protein